MIPRFFELREFFHLALLRHLSARLSGRAWAVKGGICLRFFHRSPRLSQDMDLDAVAGIRAKTLEDAVDRVLAGRALAASLAPHGIDRMAVTKPKQTGTTQRWKVALRFGSGESVPTKIEFSRRSGAIAYSSGTPDPELAARHRMPPFVAQFYGPEDMAAQKLLALAAAGRYAARDLFDLHHLLRARRIEPGALAARVEPGTVDGAAEKAGRFTHKDFKEQVLPYLSGGLMDLYAEPRAFERLKEEVEAALLEMLR